MITRKQYMSDPSLHDKYYLQFVAYTLKRLVHGHIGTKALMESKDEHFNDIPLHKWDRIAEAARQDIVSRNLAITDTASFSLSDGVCAAKAYAREYVNVRKERLHKVWEQDFVDALAYGYREDEADALAKQRMQEYAARTEDEI